MSSKALALHPDITTESGYRSEVDGLRAVAVLPVILFHAGVAWIPGGFLGVDIFFVVSGYLICRILLADLANGRFSLFGFYERRARRILPALFLVTAATLPFSWMWMAPDGFNIYLGSLWATALFGSNFYFWLSSNYFQPAAELQPLLHTWSLAVEEQFYLAFPLLLAAAWRGGRHYLVPLFGGLAVASFALSLWQIDRDAGTAFYLIHTRAWELAVGVLAALCERQMRSSIGPAAIQVVSLGAMVLVIAGFVVAAEADALPGWKSLMPVIGTAALLIFAQRGTWVAQLLGVRPLVALGLISYSAYLWHHPLFAFARHYSLNAPGAALMTGLAVVSLGLAYLSWRFVEVPWRNRSLTSTRLAFISAASGIATFVVLGAMGQQLRIDEFRFDQRILADIAPPMSKAEDCSWQRPLSTVSEIEFCYFGKVGEKHPVVLWGDSHARALKDELHVKLAELGLSGIYVNGNSCIRTPGIYRQTANMQKRAKECERFQEALFTELNKLKPSGIIVSMRWTLQMFPVPGAGHSIGFDNGEGGIESETERVMVANQPDGTWGPAPDGKISAIKILIDQLLAIAPVTVVGPIPEVGWNVGEINFKAVLIHHLPKPEISTAESRFLVRNSFILSQLEAVEKSGKARVIWPHKLLCAHGRCAAQTATTSYYSDDDHLSQQGARLVLHHVLPGP